MIVNTPDDHARRASLHSENHPPERNQPTMAAARFRGEQDSISELSTDAQSGGRDRFDGRNNAHARASLVELDGAVRESEQGPIAAGADVGTGGELGTALADQDAAGGHELGTVCLDAQTLADAVAPVA